MLTDSAFMAAKVERVYRRLLLDFERRSIVPLPKDGGICGDPEFNVALCAPKTLWLVDK
jgi:hypothetical protein